MTQSTKRKKKANMLHVAAVWRAIRIMQVAGLHPQVLRLFHEGQTTLALAVDLKPADPPDDPLPELEKEDGDVAD